MNNSLNPLLNNDDNHEDDEENNSLITNSKVQRQSKSSLFFSRGLIIVSIIIILVIGDAILMYLNKFVKVDIHKIDIYLQPEVVEYGDAQISLSKTISFKSLLHSIQVNPDTTACIINYQNLEEKKYSLTTVTLRDTVKFQPFISDSNKINIGFSNVGYGTIRDMLFNGPNYSGGEPSVSCDIDYDIYAFSFIPIKNNLYKYDSLKSAVSFGAFNIMDSINSIFEFGNLGSSVSRRLLDNSNSIAPIKFYDYAYEFDKGNSMNQFGVTAQTLIDSSNSNIPFQIGLHIPALRLLFGPSAVDANTNKNQYNISYIFNTDTIDLDLISPDVISTSFKANVTCATEGGEVCSLIYPLSFIFGRMENGTAMATGDFQNQNNFISNFLGTSHQMIFKKFNVSSHSNQPSRALLSSISNEEVERNLAAKTPRPTKRPSSRPTISPSFRPTIAPSYKPTQPTFHPTHLNVPSFEDYWYSNIYFDEWELFKGSLLFTDISAEFKVNINIDSFKIFEANTTLQWTNQVPLVTSAKMHVNIFDGYIAGEQNLFLSELDEFITESVNLKLSNDNLVLSANGSYYNLNPDVPVTNKFLVDFNSIKLTINNNTIATAAVNFSADATDSGLMAINYVSKSDNTTFFLGSQWNFAADSEHNYLAFKNIANFNDPSWDAETYVVVSPDGSIEEPGSLSYYFKVDGKATSRNVEEKFLKSNVCPVIVHLGDENVYFWRPGDYMYVMMENILLEILNRQIHVLDVKATDANPWCYWCRSSTYFNYLVTLPYDNDDSNQCFKLQKVLSDNSYYYSDRLKYEVSSFLGPFLGITTESPVVTQYSEKIITSIVEPFSYASRGDGSYGFNGLSRFDVLISDATVQANNSTLTQIRGGINVELDSSGFIIVDFVERDHGRDNVFANNEISWDINGSEGDISVRSNGTIFRDLDWNLNGQFNYLPEVSTDKKDFYLNFDLNGNTYTVKDEIEQVSTIISCNANFNINKYINMYYYEENIQGDLNNIKQAFINAYNIQDVDVDIERLYTKYFQGGFWYSGGYDPYNSYTYWPYWYYSPHMEISVRITVPVNSKVECEYLNFNSQSFGSYLSWNFQSVSVFFSYSSTSEQSLSSFLQSHPYSISQSIRGKYGNTDVIGDAKLKINGNDYKYNANLDYSNNEVTVGFAWGDQLGSSLTLRWNLDGTQTGTVDLEGTATVKNVNGIDSVASTASLSFEYSPVDSDTQFSLTSSVEGRGVDYYKKHFGYGYFTSESQLPSCRITLRLQDHNIAMYSMESFKDSIVSQLNSQLDQRGYRWLLHVNSIEVTSFRDFYEFVVIINQQTTQANFECGNIYNYLYFNQLSFNNVNFWNIQSSSSPVCPANFYYTSNSQYDRTQCDYDLYWGYYYCRSVYVYYYYCQGNSQYVEYGIEETAHSLSFNINAVSNGKYSSDSESWNCEIDEAALKINDKKAIDVQIAVYNMLPSISPTLSPTKSPLSLAPSLRPTISEYLNKISPTFKPTFEPTPVPSNQPSLSPTDHPTLAGAHNFGEHTVVFDLKERLSLLETKVIGAYVGTTNDLTLTLADVSLKVGDSIVVRENSVGGKVSYQIPNSGEFGKISIGSWNQDGKTLVYDLINSVRWIKKNDKFFMNMASSFIKNNMSLYEVGFNTSVFNSPRDVLVGLGSTLNVEKAHIFDISFITEWMNYSNRLKQPTSQPTMKIPTKKPTTMKIPTKKPSSVRKPVKKTSPAKRPTRSKSAPKGSPTKGSRRFPNIAPNRKYVYTSHSPAFVRKPSKN